VNRYQESINDHYGQPDLSGKIRQAFDRLGIAPEEVTREDLANLDEIHIRGLEATLELCKLAVGGPARTLAAEFGCEVVGLEIVGEFCHAAEMLTEWVGLVDLVSFHEGDMRAMPFDDAEFDLVFTQHTVMNVAEKAELFTEFRRVLDDDKALHYPVPWAGGTDISFLTTADELRGLITTNGFSEKHWTDVTSQALDWFDGMAAGMRNTVPKRMGPNVGVILGPDAAEKSRNLLRNLREGRIQVLQGMFVVD